MVADVEPGRRYIFVSVTGAFAALHGPPEIPTLPINCVPELSPLVPIKVKLVPVTVEVIVKSRFRKSCEPLCEVAEVNPQESAFVNVAVALMGKLPFVNGMPGDPKFSDAFTRCPPAKKDPV
jgi:hypothetical protein